MTKQDQKKLLLENMIELLELPESAYDKARDRYEDLGQWFGRDESTVKQNDPHIFPQGSFRIGTVIRPLDEKEKYDLDLACSLRAGITKVSHTQEMLKRMVGNEIETYRVARSIKDPKTEKHRCWRLEYQDGLSFHMDIVPSIPDDNIQIVHIQESIKQSGESDIFAKSIAELTVAITDDRLSSYRQISQDWNISNPEGYATWFESRSNQKQMVLEKAQVDEVPLYKRKTPLQRSIQLLKRHRDLMFKDYGDIKPVSIIITTLAARAYQGETTVEDALRIILSSMGSFVSAAKPRVPNPVNPEEDFADCWSMPGYKQLNLEQNFWKWLTQAQNDFGLLGVSDDISRITEQVRQKFSLSIDNSELSKRLGLAPAAISVANPKAHSISKQPPKPWRI